MRRRQYREILVAQASAWFRDGDLASQLDMLHSKRSLGTVMVGGLAILGRIKMVGKF